MNYVFKLEEKIFCGIIDKGICNCTGNETYEVEVLVQTPSSDIYMK